jgi:hypothetical protein
MALDTNGHDWFSEEEMGPDYTEAMMAVANDTGRQLAPFTGAIFAFLYSFSIWIVLSLPSKRPAV